MSDPVITYKETISGLLDAIAGEREAVSRAACAMGESIMRGQVIHVIGPGGHSNMAVEEMFSRAGGFACINAILDPGTNLSHGGFRSMRVERTPGYAIPVLDSYRVGATEGEVLLIINAYGVNCMTIDCALEARRRGVTSIAITSRSFADRLPKDHPSRHPTGANLYESVDIFIDNHLPYGDAILTLEGCEQNVGPTSTFCNCFAANYLVMETCRYLVSKGYTPPILRSGNLPGGDAFNQRLVDQYAGKAILLF
ncbi:sugar isomerase domain-containing protein [Flavonifractor hominis]|uniref:Sugar isomerase domain-containing protein n=1 Tax=Flavonifractor hominis TaxID=3133178 RepID=A0ABV1ERT5_9FIRM